MYCKKSCQPYKLKRAARVMADLQVEEQTGGKNQETNAVDSTTSQLMTTTNSNTKDLSASIGIDGSCGHPVVQSQQSSIPTSRCDNVVFMSNNSNEAHSSAVIPATSSSSSSTSFSNNHLACINQQPAFASPQILNCDLKSLFECPICFDYAVPPIYQCQNGHLVCQSCSSKITNCPTCRVPTSEPSIRNLQLDRLAHTFQFPCKYNFNGCQWKSYCFQKRDHEDSCEFVSYSCPCPGTACKWTGLLSQVMPHLSEHHKSITTLSGEDIVFLATDINLKGAVDWVMVQSCFNHHFLLVLEKQELKSGQQQFFAVVQLIGSQKDADKFKYKLELSNNLGGQVKRLQWEATPRSILDGIQSAISTYDCLVFDSRVAKHFLSPIRKEKDETPSCNTMDKSQGENLGINVTIDCII